MDNGLKITDIIIYPFKTKRVSNHLANAKIVFNDAFIVNGIRILKGKEDKPFITFPKEVGNDGAGKAWDICYPVTPELRHYIEEMVIGRWEEVNRQKVCETCGQVIVNKEEK